MESLFILDEAQATIPSKDNKVCRSCGRYKRCLSPFTNQSVVISPHSFVFVVDKPFCGAGEDIKNTSLYKFLKIFLNKLNINVDEVNIIPAVLCSGASKPSIKETRMCGYFFNSILNTQNAKVLIACGSVAKKSLGLECEVTSGRGNVYTLPDGRKVVYTYDVETVKNKLENKDKNGNSVFLDFANDVVRGVRLTSGEDNKIERVLVNSRESVDSMVAYFDDKFSKGDVSYFAFDTETTGLYPYLPDGDIIMVSLSCDKTKGFAVPVVHNDSFWRDKLRINYLHSKLSYLFEKYPVVGHNLKFDLNWLHCHLGIVPKNCYFDTLNGNHLLYAGTVPSNLQYLANSRTDIIDHKAELSGYREQILYRKKKEIVAASNGNMTRKEVSVLAKQYSDDFRNIPIDLLYKYAVDDAVSTYAVAESLIEELKKKNQWDAYVKLYQKNQLAVAQMEYDGIKIDRAYFKRLCFEEPKEIANLLDTIKKNKYYDIFRVKYGEFNAANSQDKAKMVFDVIGAPTRLVVLGKNHKGSVSFGKKTQEKVLNWANSAKRVDKEAIEMVNLIVSFNHRSFIYSQHIEKLLDLMAPCSDPPESVTSHLKKMPVKYTVHPDIQLVTKTGRASARNPPIHGVPNGSNVRKQYISRWGRGGLLGSFDYSQMELRVLAALTKDKGLLEAFSTGNDIHRQIAAMCLNKPIYDVSDSTRKKFKSVTFGIVYGQSDRSLAKALGIKEEEATSIRTSIFGSFPGIRSFVSSQTEYVKKYGEVWSVMGRVRPLNRKFFRDENSIIRRAVNTPIQSAASDNTYLAWCDLFHAFGSMGINSRPLIFTHDSILVDIYPGELKTVLTQSKIYMEDKVSDRCSAFIGVPFLAEYEIGPTWLDMVKIKSFDDKSVTFKFNSMDSCSIYMREFGAYFMENFSNISDAVKVEKDGFVSFLATGYFK